jgi:16S rRNA (cytosine967-C5)-methyltransferase
MHYLWQHLETILSVYNGKLPLHHFLKDYFRQHTRLGSRDRRGLSDAAYSWYRAGKALAGDEHDIKMKRLAAMQLCGLRPKAFAAFFPDNWQDGNLPGFHIQREEIFPYDIAFSEGISKAEWMSSMLRQPRLFLRIRKDHDQVTRVLQAQHIPHEWLTPHCLVLPNGVALEGLLPADAYVVQDASSQATGNYLDGKKGEHWWDCCSGAGGKSLMLTDASKGIHLLATDIRESILQNLTSRFRQYHLPLPERIVLDTADAGQVAALIGDRKFDNIICDVPCSGSGTWARTPESCYFFEPDMLEQYKIRQQSIPGNAAQYLKPGGRIIYITCSVFRAENEAIVSSVAAQHSLRIETSQLINGIAHAADSMFVAVLYKA